MTRKSNFLWVVLGSSSIIWDWHKVWPWSFASAWKKDWNLKSESFWGRGTNSYVCRSYREKTGRGEGGSPILNRVKGLSMTTTHTHVTNPQEPTNFLAYSHQNVANKYKYIQYNQIFCSHNQLEILWAVSMLLLGQFLC